MQRWRAWLMAHETEVWIVILAFWALVLLAVKTLQEIPTPPLDWR